MISLKNDKIYTLVNNVVLIEEEGSTYNNNNNNNNNLVSHIPGQILASTETQILSINLSSNTAYTLASIFGRHFLSFSLYVLTSKGGRQTGIPVYQVLKGVS